MVQVHPSHLKGNLAVSTLAQELAQVGILAETLSNDYGEDLLLQTHLNNVADSFSVRIQIKYANLRKNRKGKYFYRFSKRHLWRWINHADPILVCLFDEQTKRCLLADPKNQFSLWQLSTTKRKSLLMYFSDDDVSSPATLVNLIWNARLQYYSANIARLENSIIYFYGDEDDQEKRKRIQLEIGVILFAFLRAIKILVPHKFDPKFREYVSNSAQNLVRYPEMNLRSAFMLAVLARAGDLKIGLPSNLMERATDLCGHYFRMAEPKIWRKLSKLYKKKWYPYDIKRTRTV